MAVSLFGNLFGLEVYNATWLTRQQQSDAKPARAYLAVRCSLTWSIFLSKDLGRKETLTKLYITLMPSLKIFIYFYTSPIAILLRSIRLIKLHSLLPLPSMIPI